VKLRRVPATLALGLPAALLGHALLFGSDHEVGGPVHGLLVGLGFALCAGILAFFAALAWRGNGAADGSVLASRLRDCLPGVATIFIAAASYFTLFESFEQTHAVNGVPTTLALLLFASWSVRELARFAIRLIAEAVIAVVRFRYAARAANWPIRTRPIFVFVPNPATRRRFARPPPTMPARV
jgi:hypothetical protein